LALFAAVGSLALAAPADSDAAWLKDRQARFSAYRAAHPRLELDIAEIKAKTAALVANAGPLASSALDAAPVIWRTSPTPLEIWDGADLPEMVVIPAGEYTMGSPDSAPQRDANEGPRHRVRIGHALAVSRYEVTVGEFARFVADTHHVTGDVCYTYQDGGYADRSPRTWRRPTGGEDASDALPAMCLTWSDAQAYAAWLAQRTGRPYRLMSEAEYEYANRAGSTTTYWWGDEIGTNRANCNGCGSVWDLKQIAPAGSFAPNPFGLYDTSGNAWSWMADCWNDSYADAPTDGSAKLTGDCATRTVRGGGWSTHAWILRTARRVGDAAAGRHGTVGFRVAFTL
jgi:formylglycine-generating enzyme required for sulfatase activity